MSIIKARHRREGDRVFARVQSSDSGRKHNAQPSSHMLQSGIIEEI